MPPTDSKAELGHVAGNQKSTGAYYAYFGGKHSCGKGSQVLNTGMQQNCF